MSSSFSSRTIGSETDARLVLSNAEHSRVFAMGTNWTKVRVGVRFCLNAAASNMSGNFALGLSASASDGFGRTSATHCVGVRCAGGSANWNTGLFGSVHYFNAAISGAMVATKRIGGTNTDGSAVSSSAPYIVNEPATNRCCLFVEITKGSPNFTIQLGFASSAGSACTDVGYSKFCEAMEWPQWSFKDLSGWISGYAVGSAITLAVSEATAGNLVAATCCFKLAGSIEICDLAASRLT